MRAVSLRALASGRGSHQQVPRACDRCCAVACAAAPPRRIDVVGAGFAGLAVTYFLLKQAAAAQLHVHVCLHDAEGVGGGASGVAAGLLNPFSPRSDTSLWRGEEGCAATERLLAVAQQALGRPVSCLSGSLHPLKSTGKPRSWRQQLSAEQAWTQFGLRLPAPFSGVDLYAGGRVIDAPAYLAGLWVACQAAGQHDAGNRVQLCTQLVPSLAHLAAQGACDVIVCAGAATTLLPELEQLPLTTSGGHVAVLESPALARDSPAVMLPGAGYCAPTGDGSVVVGATKKLGVPPESSFYAGEVPLTDAGALDALDALLPPAQASLPALADSTVRCVKWGVRALPPRTQLGALPLLGRLPERPGAAHTWVLVGLGARGLVYHALLAEQLATAVLTGDHGALPRECAPPMAGAAGASSAH